MSIIYFTTVGFVATLFCLLIRGTHLIQWTATTNKTSLLITDYSNMLLDCSLVFSFFIGGTWHSGLHVWLVMCRSWVRAPSKAPIVSFSKNLYPYCLVLVVSGNGFEHDFTIKLKKIKDVMEDWLKYEIFSPRVKYHQNQKTNNLVCDQAWGLSRLIVFLVVT